MTVPKSGSKYNARLCPPYQVAHTSCQAGKVFTGSKHRVTFAFGFADPDALCQGLTGPEARGEEHEVKLVWSHTSGKRQVIADNQEVHFSVGKPFEPRFETSWTLEGGHTVRIIAHSTLAMFNSMPGFRQFELFLDGMSYFSMAKIFELGVKSQIGQYNTVQSKASSEQYHLQDKQRSSFAPEGRDFAQAPTRDNDLPSRVADDVSEPGKHLSSVASPSGVADMPNTQIQDFLWTGEEQQDLLASVAVPELHSSRDEFSPVAPVPVPESPSFALAMNQILSAYCPPQTNVSASGSSAGSPMMPHCSGSHALARFDPRQQANHRHYDQYPQAVQQQHNSQPPVTPTHYDEPSKTSYHTPAPGHQISYPQPGTEQHQTLAYAVEPTNSAPPVKLTMAPLAIEDIVEDLRSPEMTGMAKTLHSLVNLDDINEQQASPEDRKFQQKKQQAHREIKSKPLPPKQPDWSLGLQPNLQAMKEKAPVTSAPKKEIMRPHVFDPNAVQAGMMVMYGKQPPLQPQPPMMMPHVPSYYR